MTAPLPRILDLWFMWVKPTTRRIKGEGGGWTWRVVRQSNPPTSLWCVTVMILLLSIYMILLDVLSTHMLLPCIVELTWSRWTCVMSSGRWISCYIYTLCIDICMHADRQYRAFEHISEDAHMLMIVGGLLSTIAAQCDSLSSAHLSCYSNNTTLLWYHTLCNTRVPHHKLSHCMSVSNIFSSAVSA